MKNKSKLRQCVSCIFYELNLEKYKGYQAYCNKIKGFIDIKIDNCLYFNANNIKEN